MLPSALLSLLCLRVAAVHAGRHAEPPGQQRGADQTHGHGGGGVPERPHGPQQHQAEVRGTVDKSPQILY